MGNSGQSDFFLNHIQRKCIHCRSKHQDPQPKVVRDKNLVEEIHDDSSSSGGQKLCASSSSEEVEKSSKSPLTAAKEEKSGKSRVLSSLSPKEKEKYKARMLEKRAELWETYIKQIKESDGFDVDCFPGPCDMYSYIPIPICRDDVPPAAYEYVAQMARDCLLDFNKNQLNHGEPEYVFLKIERVVAMGCAGYLYHLTFQAKQNADPPTDDDRDAVAVEDIIKTFQGKLYISAGREPEREVTLCRLKKEKGSADGIAIGNANADSMPTVCSYIVPLFFPKFYGLK